MIKLFEPLAREKINKEMARHTDNPEVAEQIAQVVVGAAQQATGIADPLEAVVAAKSEPATVHAVQVSSLDELAKVAPLLDKIAEWDAADHAAGEASRDAASARAKAEGIDMAPALASRAFVVYMVVLGATLTMMGVQMWLSPDKKPAGELVGFFIAVATLGARQWERLFEYRFGTSRSSAAKDVVIGQLARKA